jgi:hypothetical protein
MGQFDRRWTPAMDAELRRRYFSEYVKDIAADLGVSTIALFHRARRIGLKKNRQWTAANDLELRELWGECSLAELSGRLKRTQATLYWRGQLLGLTSQVPRGFEYLTHAADRTGYDTGQLRAILKWAGVRLRVSMGRPVKHRSRRHHIVDPYDVNEAIARWLRTEPLASAASRRGVSASVLERRLRLLPKVPRKPKGKKHWRVPSDLIDQALATPLPKPQRRHGAHGYFARAVAA